MLSHGIIKGMKSQTQLALTHLMAEEGVTVTPKNEGRQLVIYRYGQVVDFWPASGKWYHRNKGIKGQGLVRLRKSLEPEPEIGGAFDEEGPSTQEEMPILVKSDDSCIHCDNPSSIGVHGVREGQVVSRYYCSKCFVRKYKQGIASAADIARLSEE